MINDMRHMQVPEVAKDILDDIRRSVEDESLSFIVGAGFSRNVSNRFPLWDELLRPIAEDLYPGYPAEEKIAEKTYLGIASEYVRRKGYHEAIDLHIEKVVPYLRRRDGGGYELVADGVVVDPNPFTECHEKLLALGARHIFTFNYDNTLDVLAEVDVSNELLKDQLQADNKLWAYTKLLDKYKIEYAALKKIDADSAYEHSESKGGVVDFSSINCIIDELGLSLQPYTCSSEIQPLYNQHIDRINREIDSHKAVAQNTKIQRASRYHLITDAYQISLTDSCRNIYKLHGNLRTNSEDPYEFDGDRHVQYVITQEDYDTYPEKHEAFVNLMRISLLKGHLCLIGFSGDDPNFLGWINWVKDILDYSASREVSPPRTIYYINAEPGSLDSSKKLLLKNHYIKVLNLHEAFPGARSRTERILMFLNSLSRDVQKYSAYDESWGRLDVDRNKPDVINRLSSYVESVYKLSEFNRIPNQFSLPHYRRTNIFSNLKSIIKSDADLSLSSKLIFSAIRGELMPVYAVLSQKQFNKLSKASVELRECYRRLSVRAKVLSGTLYDDTTSDWSAYESALSLLFNLRFDRAKSLIDAWSPSSCVDKMRRFMLQSVYEDELDTDSMTNLINQDNFSCLQDYKFAIDLLPKIRGIYTQTKKGGLSVYADLQHKIDMLSKQHPGLIDFQDQMDRLTENVDKRQSKAFGNVKESFSFSSYDPALVNSIKIIQIFLELGMPTETRNVILFDKEKWLKVCARIFEYYPSPCLYFTLLYGNNKELVRRIAQQYIFSAKLKDDLPDLLIKMLEALSDKSSPRNIREAIYIAAPIFMKAVHPNSWLAEFEKFFDSLDLDKLGENKGIDELAAFVLAGVELAGNDEFKHKVLLENLQLRDRINDIHNSLIIASSKGLQMQESEREELLQLLVCSSTPVHMYVLMNMEKWLGRDTVSARLRDLDDSLYADCTLLEAAARYAAGDSFFQARLKAIILDSSLLWRTGINKTCTSVGHFTHTLDICEIQQYIQFDDNEVKLIYDKLSEAFSQIDTIARKWHERRSWSFISDWSYVLVEMQDFLRCNRSILKKEVNYTSLSRSITRLLNQGRGGNSIASLLIDDRKIGKAITWLVHDVYNSGPQHLQHEYMLLVNKLLSCQSMYSNSCFKHFGWAITQFEHDFDRALFKPLVKNLLESYKPFFSGKNELVWDVEYAEKNVVESVLRKVYQVYKSWGGNILFWENYIPRYYDV